MVRRKKDQRDKNERREDALRPNRYLGYDHDALGVHLLSREAYEIAVCCFRRAIWLNPFEPAFKEHLAWCLYKLGRYTEALQIIPNQPDNNDNKILLELIKGKLKNNGQKQT